MLRSTFRNFRIVFRSVSVVALWFILPAVGFALLPCYWQRSSACCCQNSFGSFHHSPDHRRCSSCAQSSYSCSFASFFSPLDLAEVVLSLILFRLMLKVRKWFTSTCPADWSLVWSVSLYLLLVQRLQRPLCETLGCVHPVITVDVTSSVQTENCNYNTTECVKNQNNHWSRREWPKQPPPEILAICQLTALKEASNQHFPIRTHPSRSTSAVAELAQTQHVRGCLARTKNNLDWKQLQIKLKNNLHMMHTQLPTYIELHMLKSMHTVNCDANLCKTSDTFPSSGTNKNSAANGLSELLLASSHPHHVVTIIIVPNSLRSAPLFASNLHSTNRRLSSKFHQLVTKLHWPNLETWPLLTWPLDLWRSTFTNSVYSARAKPILLLLQLLRSFPKILVRPLLLKTVLQWVNPSKMLTVTHPSQCFPLLVVVVVVVVDCNNHLWPACSENPQILCPNNAFVNVSAGFPPPATASKLQEAKRHPILQPQVTWLQTSETSTVSTSSQPTLLATDMPL